MLTAWHTVIISFLNTPWSIYNIHSISINNKHSNSLLSHTIYRICRCFNINCYRISEPPVSLLATITTTTTTHHNNHSVCVQICILKCGFANGSFTLYYYYYYYTTFIILNVKKLRIFEFSISFSKNECGGSFSIDGNKKK